MPDTQERRGTRRIDCFNQAITNTEIERSMVVDISNEGAGLLLLKDKSFFRDEDPKKRPVVSDRLLLTIFHPDLPSQETTSIETEIAWVDHDYSDNHRKIGVHFVGINEEQSNYISKLIEWLSKESNYFLHCDYQKY